MAIVLFKYSLNFFCFFLLILCFIYFQLICNLISFLLSQSLFSSYLLHMSIFIVLISIFKSSFVNDFWLYFRCRTCQKWLGLSFICIITLQKRFLIHFPLQSYCFLKFFPKNLFNFHSFILFLFSCKNFLLWLIIWYLWWLCMVYTFFFCNFEWLNQVRWGWVGTVFKPLLK